MPVRSQSLSLPPNRRPIPVQIDSNSTVESTRTSATYRGEAPLPTIPAFPRKPWRDFAKENSSPRNSFAGSDRPGISPSSTDVQPSSSSRASSSRALLSAIDTNPLASSQKARTHYLSLARPPHTRAYSSASFLATITSPGPSRTVSLRRSSPQLITRPSFPSRSASPSPLRHRVSEGFNHTRSNSTALFRSVSERSKARFSRSFHTANDSIDVADYAAAQCEAAFVSDVLLPTAEEDSLDRNDDPTAEGVLVDSVPESENNGTARHSAITKWKKMGGKVKNFIRVVRGSIPMHRKAKYISLEHVDRVRRCRYPEEFISYHTSIGANRICFEFSNRACLGPPGSTAATKTKISSAPFSHQDTWSTIAHPRASRLSIHRSHHPCLGSHSSRSDSS